MGWNELASRAPCAVRCTDEGFGSYPQASSLLISSPTSTSAVLASGFERPDEKIDHTLELWRLQDSSNKRGKISHSAPLALNLVALHQHVANCEGQSTPQA